MSKSNSMKIHTAGHFRKKWKSCSRRVGAIDGLADCNGHEAATREADVSAARRIVKTCLGRAHLAKAEILLNLFREKGHDPVIVASYRQGSQNRLATELANYMGENLGIDVDHSIQSLPGQAQKHLSVMQRSFNVPEFVGEVQKGRSYILVDDYVQTGESLARLRDYIEDHGGQVLFGFTLASPDGQSVEVVRAYDDQISKIESGFADHVLTWMRSQIGDLRNLSTVAADRILSKPKEIIELSRSY